VESGDVVALVTPRYGMRFMGGGAVEFTTGNRSNTVQVAVLSLAADQTNSAAVNLARKIAPQVPQ
jgi:hypothetical protein